MGATTKISWCDKTWNGWLGCQRVSMGCENCYAEILMDTRYGKVEWGPTGTRIRTGENNWHLPVRWNKERWFECVTCGHRFAEKRPWEYQFGCPECKQDALKPTRQRVFTASLSDIFEYRAEVGPWREELFELIEATPEIDWLILTKRIDLVRAMAPLAWIHHGWPQNVWLGTSVENQAMAEKRIPWLAQMPVHVRFLSVEPLLGPVDLWPWLSNPTLAATYGVDLPMVSWVIVGGESGPHFRPMKHHWAQLVVDQCRVTNVPVFMKQDAGPQSGLYDRLPDTLKVRQFPLVTLQKQEA